MRVAAQVSTVPPAKPAAKPTSRPRLAFLRGRSWKFYAALAVAIPALLFVVLVGYAYVQVSGMIDARMHGEFQRTDPRIFGRPLTIRRGQRVTLVQMVDRLNDLGYAQRSPVEQPGQFAIGQNALAIVPRAGDRAGQTVRFVFSPPTPKGGGGTLQCAVLDIGGEPSAYAFYRVNAAFERGSGIGHTLVVEAIGISPEATHAVWRFLFGIDWMARVKAHLLPVDHPLLLSAAEPRRLNFHLREGIWVRLIDVEAALSARAYASDDAIVIEVADEFCSWNAGHWRVARGGVVKTDAPADLACEVASLGCVYLGGFSFAELARAMRVRELADGAIARADALFRTDRKPWCPEIF